MAAISSNIHAVILAGGQSLRMGKDKPCLTLRNKLLIDHVAQRIPPQVATTYISANGELKRFQHLDLQCVRDQRQPPRGPLEGILSTLEHISQNSDTSSGPKWLLSAPADCPFLPLDLGQRLQREVEKNNLAASYASYFGKDHYLSAIWSTSLIPVLKSHLEGERYSVRSFLSIIASSACNFNNETHDPFFNINTPEDLRSAEALLDTET